MAEPLPAALTHIHLELIKLTQAWALRRPFDAARAADLRRQAILLNHQHYLATIPAYRRLAQEAGIGPVDELGPLVEQLLVSDDLFKSYSQRWLDDNDFGRMNGWLSTIHHRPVQVDVAGVASIDGWIDRLGQHGVLPVYSSGTSGAFSFIPRDRAMWELVRLANTCYLLPLLTFDKLGAAWQRLLVRAVLSQWDAMAPQPVAPETVGALERLRRGRYVQAGWGLNRPTGRFASGVVVMPDEFDILDHPLCRLVVVRPVPDLAAALQHLHPGVSAAGVYPEPRRLALRDAIATRGVSSILPLGRCEQVFAGMPHDGMLVLSQLVDWKCA